MDTQCEVTWPSTTLAPGDRERPSRAARGERSSHRGERRQYLLQRSGLLYYSPAVNVNSSGLGWWSDSRWTEYTRWCFPVMNWEERLNSLTSYPAQCGACMQLYRAPPEELLQDDIMEKYTPLSCRLSRCQRIVWMDVVIYIVDALCHVLRAVVLFWLEGKRIIASVMSRWQPASGLTVMQQHLLHAQSFNKLFKRCWILNCCIESWQKNRISLSSITEKLGRGGTTIWVSWHKRQSRYNNGKWLHPSKLTACYRTTLLVSFIIYQFYFIISFIILK